MWQARQAQQQAQEAQQQAQQAQQQQRWDMDWADDPLIASPLDCPPSPAISWLKDFEL
jgi:type II secretory pathway pseudopilin PulG